MKSSTWPAVSMLAGASLMLAGPLLLAVAPTGTFWTDADQAQYQKASAEFHAASYNLPRSDDGSHLQGRAGDRYDPVAAKAKYEAAKSEYEKQKARLSAAQSHPAWLTSGLRLLGVLMVSVGIYGYIRARGQQTRQGTFAKAGRLALPGHQGGDSGAIH